MGDYDRYQHGDTIEMGMGGERLGPNRTRTTLGGTSSSTIDDPPSFKADHAAALPPADGGHPLGDDLPQDTDYQPVNWKRVLFTPKYLVLWILLIIIGVLTAIISLKHDQVVEALRPFAEKVRDIPAGWLIFVAVLFVISFPPLFGHELVALLAGVVYGLWIGFGIVAAGTFVGEIGTWFAFMKFFRKKAEKMERTNLTYGAMAKLCRDGGFWMIFVIRLSIIPSHMSTAVFSTCDVKFWHFAVSTFFTLPKQLILVYLGVLLVGGKSDFWIKFGLFGIAGGVTVIAGVWIWYKMRAIKKDLLARQARVRAEKASRSTHMMSMGSNGSGGAGAAVNGDERMPLERNNSYNHLAPEHQQQTQAGYGMYSNELNGNVVGQASTTHTRTEYTAYSPPLQTFSPPQPEGYGFAQTTDYPAEVGSSGDLGVYGRAAPYPSSVPLYPAEPSYPVPHDSPEQRKAVNPHGFV